MIIQTTNAILHVDQTSRIIGLPLNGWAHRTTDLPALSPHGDEAKTRASALGLMLEAARLVFIDDRNILLILADGTIHVVNVGVEGRLVSRFTIGEAIARTSPPSVVQMIQSDHLFIGSTAGPALLLRTIWNQLQQSDNDVHMKSLNEEDDFDIDEGELVI